MEGKALISSSQEVSLLAGFQSSLHTTLCLVDVSFPDGKDVQTVYVRSNNHRSRVNDFAKQMQAMVLTGLILHSRKPEEGFLPGVHAGTVHLGRCSSSLAVPLYSLRRLMIFGYPARNIVLSFHCSFRDIALCLHKITQSLCVEEYGQARTSHSVW